MKCTDCGKEFEERKDVRQMKAELNNPRVVFFSAKAYECPNCRQHFTDEEDMEEAMKSFDEQHEKEKKTSLTV